MEVGALQIYAGQIGLRQIHAAEIRFDFPFLARFHPDLVLIQNLRKIEQRDSNGITFARSSPPAGFPLSIFALQFIHFFDCLYLQAHSNSFPAFFARSCPSCRT